MMLLALIGLTFSLVSAASFGEDSAKGPAGIKSQQGMPVETQSNDTPAKDLPGDEDDQGDDSDAALITLPAELFVAMTTSKAQIGNQHPPLHPSTSFDRPPKQAISS